VKILTANIRDARADDGANNWLQRRELCARIIENCAAEIICFQELRQQQRDFIAAALPSYASYGLPEGAAATDAPNAIFWRRANFTCIDSGGYWLSEQPQLAGSRSWGSQSVRLANFVVLQHPSGKTLRIINTHLDNGSQIAREQQARLLVDKCAAKCSGELQILCGDMNCAAGNSALEILCAAGWRDSYAAVHKNCDSGFTYHAFSGSAYDPKQYPDEPQGRIDWIFVRGNLAVSAAEIIRSSENGRFPSDHYFVSATLIL
jgi:endonuclease/exonuclease/phosphatase family metal-dependent hydrolase